MSFAIRIITSGLSLQAELNESATSQAIWDALPISASGNRWGEEIYFSIPVEAGEAPDARAEMEVGELGYWPPGTAFCIFFGPTPASRDKQPRAASPVNPVGRLLDEAGPLTDVPDGAEIRIEQATDGPT